MTQSVEVHTEQRILAPDRVSFFAYVDGKKVDCVITGEALRDHFRGAGRPISEVFDENRETISNMAEYLINARHHLVDGTLMIDPRDADRYG